MAVSRGFRRAAVTASAFALFASAVLAQGDPLAEARARQRIADQKVEAAITEALRDAERVAKTNPARAAQIISAAQSSIDTAVGISGESRKMMTSLLQSKSNAIAGRPSPAGGAKSDPLALEMRAKQSAEFQKFAAENKAVRDGIAKIEQYQLNREYEKAKGIVGLLAEQYPNNTAVIALQAKDSFANNIADARMLSQMQAERSNVAMNAVLASAIPAKGDIEFPKDWVEKTKRRKSLEPQLTEVEKSIVSALDKPMSAAYNGQPLEEVIQQLTNTLGHNIFVDQKSLKDLEIDLKKPVMLEAKGVPARIVLRQLLAGNGLTFVVKDEAIQVVTVEKARTMLVTRVYYLGDVVQGVGPFGGLTWGPFVDYQQTTANVKMIIDSITSSIDPLSWADKSGPGTVTFHFPSMSLIVRASSEVHASLSSRIGPSR